MLCTESRLAHVVGVQSCDPSESQNELFQGHPHQNPVARTIKSPFRLQALIVQNLSRSKLSFLPQIDSLGSRESDAFLQYHNVLVPRTRLHTRSSAR